MFKAEPRKLIAEFASKIGPGLLVSVVVALAAQFLSEHYGAPAMLMALLLGLAFHFLAEEGRCVDGIEFAAQTILRFGVALLGARISFDLLIGLGPKLISLVVAAVFLTILFGLLGAKLLGRGWRLALLTGGSVAICGVSAAMAIAAILPKNEHSERNLLFTVISVTMLSTVAMIAYPVLTELLGFNDHTTGVFLGGTIHDVAQVIGAGFSVSQETGEAATVVKLIRVVMLGPVVILFAFVMRGFAETAPATEQRPPLIPGFILIFLTFATVNSVGGIPKPVATFLGDTSRWALLVAIAAVGMKTSLGRIRDVGGAAVVLIIAETVFIAALILLGIMYLP